MPSDESDPQQKGADADATAGEDGDASDSEDGYAPPEPAVQSEALRRQQLFVGSGIAALGGIAVTVATLQQLPAVPFVGALVGGMLTAGLLFAIVFAGVFRGSGD